MYYLSKHGGALNPAEGPHLCRSNESHEWGYGQKKHHEAIRNQRAQVDFSAPESINPAAQKSQIRTRQFYVDARRVEIARENRKLVGRLESIAKGCGGVDPRAPPPQKSLSSSSLSGGILSGAGASLAGPQHSKSSNDLGRKQMQKMIDHDNASLVRRILAVGPTLDRKAETRDFLKHKRAVHNLMKLPEAPGSSAGSRTKHLLSPTETRRVPRQPRLPENKKNAEKALSGMDCLFLPGDLSWVGGGSGQDGALDDGYDDGYGGYGDDDGGYGGDDYGDDGADGGGHGTFAYQGDDQPEHRRWTADEDDPSRDDRDDTDDRMSRRPPSGDASKDAADEWDDGSFSAER